MNRIYPFPREKLQLNLEICISTGVSSPGSQGPQFACFISGVWYRSLRTTILHVSGQGCPILVVEGQCPSCFRLVVSDHHPACFVSMN